MLGGYRFKELFGEPNAVNYEHLKQVALGAIKSYLKIQEDPVHHLVSIHQVCVAQSLQKLLIKRYINIELHSTIHTQPSAKSRDN